MHRLARPGLGSSCSDKTIQHEPKISELHIQTGGMWSVNTYQTDVHANFMFEVRWAAHPQSIAAQSEHMEPCLHGLITQDDGASRVAAVPLAYKTYAVLLGEIVLLGTVGMIFPSFHQNLEIPSRPLTIAFPIRVQVAVENTSSH